MFAVVEGWFYCSECECGRESASTRVWWYKD